MQEATYDEKVLSLLRYALAKRGVSEHSYFIGREGEERSQTDRLCLLRAEDNHWTVLYTERGSISQSVTHSDIGEAVVDFFWKLTRKDTPWDYRAEWESETGKLF